MTHKLELRVCPLVPGLGTNYTSNSNSTPFLFVSVICTILLSSSLHSWRPQPLFSCVLSPTGPAPLILDRKMQTQEILRRWIFSWKFGQTNLEFRQTSDMNLVCLMMTYMMTLILCLSLCLCLCVLWWWLRISHYTKFMSLVKRLIIVRIFITLGHVETLYTVIVSWAWGFIVLWNFLSH